MTAGFLVAHAGVSPAGFGALFAVTALAGAIQRLGGQGFGTITVGFAALLAPGHVPVVVLLLGLVATLGGVGLDFRAVRRAELWPAVAGRFAGTIPAVFLLSALVGSPSLQIAVALVILLGVGLSLLGLRIAKTGAALFVAGGLSGFMATLTSVGAAPMGLVYQNEEARAARGTLNAFFLLGLVFSVSAVAIKGLVEARHLWLALGLAPAVMLGVFGSAPLAARMAGAPLKPLALSLATGAAALLLIRVAL